MDIMITVLRRTIPILFVLYHIAFGQGFQYTWSHPFPQGNAVFGLTFIDDLHGWAAAGGGELLRTSDGGDSWILLHPPRWVADGWSDIIVLPSGHLIAAGYHPSLSRSTDGGTTWSAINSATQQRLRHLAQIPGGGVSAVGDSGTVLVSHDDGATWKEISCALPGMVRHHRWRSSTEAYIAGDGIGHRTTDGGMTWQRVMPALHPQYNTVFFPDTGSVRWYGDFSTASGTVRDSMMTEQPLFTAPLYVYRVEAVSPDHWYAVTNGEGAELWETSNGGAQWELRTAMETIAGFTAFHRTAGGRLLIASETGEIHLSEDGGKTLRSGIRNENAGARSASITAFIRRDPTTLFACTGSSYGTDTTILLWSDDAGKHWRRSPQTVPAGTIIEGLFTDPVHGIAMNAKGLLFSVDSGNTWSVATMPSGLRVNTLAAAGSGTVFAACGSSNAGSSDGALLRSTDNGATWSKCNGGLPQQNLTVVGVAFAGPQTGMISGMVNDTKKFFRTSDGGGTWEDLTVPGLPGPSMGLWWLSSTTVLAGGQYFPQWGIYRSTDRGDHWDKVSEERIHRFSFRNALEGVAVMMNASVLHTVDGGQTWTRIREPFVGSFPERTSEATAAFMTDDGILLIGGAQSKIVRASLFPPMHAAFAEHRPPERMTLMQNYPNPFNPSTTIPYTIPAAGHASLMVYDLMGRRVAILSDEYQTSGSHHRWFHSEHLSSGVYLAVLRYGGASRTMTMLLLK